MNTRLLLAGVAAGVVMFAWGAISHMVLPLGEVGIQPLSEEAAITAVFKDKIKGPGLYLYPYSQDSAALPSLGSRITLAVGMVVLAIAGHLVPLWNWYGFPAPFVAAAAVDAIIGVILGTLVISRIALNPRRA